MDILKKPIITEKQTIATDKLGTFGFIVEKKTNKIQIKKSKIKNPEFNQGK